VLVNLLSNALKYSPREAPVTVWGVTDRGSGISSEDLPHIFDRFYRAEKTSQTEGLGLGLAITRMLVRAHGGKIEVESRVGEGSTFTVWLPAG
jgi:two-component system sensor histidine kinase BaeS